MLQLKLFHNFQRSRFPSTVLDAAWFLRQRSAQVTGGFHLNRNFDFFPAHADRPKLRAHGNGVIFSAVFHSEGEHGLQLIRKQDGETFYIPLTEEYRIGRVYSVMVTPFRAQDWLYRYRNNGHWILDPHATGIVSTKIRAEEDGTGKAMTTQVNACSCTELRTGELFPGAPERPLPPVSWTKQVIYSLHVRGLTISCPETFPGRGGFAGLAQKIPYLKDLGVTAVELMPVYLPLPDRRRQRTFRTMEEALGAWPVGPQGGPLRDMKERPNYWGFGRGLYYALRPSYGSRQEFARMVHDLHQSGIRIILQMYFEKGTQTAGQIDVLRYYVEQFCIDGFRLLGHLPSVEAIASCPALENTAVFCGSFPFEQLEEAADAEIALCTEDLDLLSISDTDFSDIESISSGEPAALLPDSGKVTPGKNALSGNKQTPVFFPNLITCGDDFQTLLRRFVKSDDYAMKDFLKLFLGVPEKHGELRTVTSFDGFTLADLVSYSERHNEANGEFGLDGRTDNYSWNCGEEGVTENEEVLALRRKQVRNFLTLLFLSQGTPLLRHGDERANSQGGNNNPYCQDNEISWLSWDRKPEQERLTSFTARLIAFRKDHPVFSNTVPFRYIDTLGIGYPDVSLHGEEAWKPDLGPFSHSIGISYCENYASEKGRKDLPPAFVYLAVNMYWKELKLALPKLPPFYLWKVFADTETEDCFLENTITPADQHYVQVSPRSIRILRAVPDTDAIARSRKKELKDRLPACAALKRIARRKTHNCQPVQSRRLCGRTPGSRRRMRHLFAHAGLRTL